MINKRIQLNNMTMKISRIFITAIFISGSLLATGKDDKKKDAPGAASGPLEGVVYSLPQTGIRVHIKATRERFVNGPFCNYASKMLGIDNAPTTSSDRWNIDEMQLETFSQPDPDQVRKALGQSAQLVSLTQSGILAGINTDVKTQESGIETQSFLTKDLQNRVNFTDLSIWSFYSPADSTKSFKMVS